VGRAAWYLRNEDGPGIPDAGTFQYGAAHWDYLAGSWGAPAALPVGLAELASGAPPSADAAIQPLTDQQLQETVTAALVRLEEAGVNPAVLARLESTTYEVGPLSAPLLGYTYARSDTVVIDPNAEGYGWFVDPTPLSDEEFARSRTGTLAAFPGGPADGRMDLLTVVLHEMGHLAGRRDISTAGHPDNLMDDTLAPGLRRVDALNAIFAGGKT
jgi:hypothetical protein